MNTRLSLAPRLLLLLGLAFTPPGIASAADLDDDSKGPMTSEQLTPEQLDQLLGPIALYPDALVALILPASIAQTEIVLAARYLNSNGSPDQIDAQPWSESVRALARYPEIIQWMDSNLQWTRELGDAVYSQPADVMNAVQRLRGIARANGTLVDTPQQRVVVDQEVIEIVPAQPDVIYVPRYDPDVVYYSRAEGYYPSEPFITFGLGFAAGLWLSYDFDWHRRAIFVGDRRNWRDQRDWRRDRPPSRTGFSGNPGWHAWNPPVSRPRPPRDFNRGSPRVIRPHPFPGTPDHARPPSGGAGSFQGDRGDRRSPQRPVAPRESGQLPVNRGTLPANPNRPFGPAVEPPRATPMPNPYQRATPSSTDTQRVTPPSTSTQLVTPPSPSLRSANPPDQPRRGGPGFNRPPRVDQPPRVDPSPRAERPPVVDRAPPVERQAPINRPPAAGESVPRGERPPQMSRPPQANPVPPQGNQAPIQRNPNAPAKERPVRERDAQQKEK
ncbi:MAG: hypothetical protein JWM88_2079 [Verrucomicrobia bacterium]|nr:hypothetical protein [Verrucomicrobiota bacterium]